MNVIVCLDNNGGMLFNKRRQSQDKVLRKRILEISSNGNLWMNSYSKKQFEIDSAQIIVDENFLHNASSGDFCFVENSDLADFENQIEKIIVFKWNRTYPADFHFCIPLSEWNMIESTEFKGNSHEKITQEVYTR